MVSVSEDRATGTERGTGRPADAQRQADAKTSFVKLMAWSLVAAVAMSVGAVGYLVYTSVALNATVLIATVLGVFFSVLLGAGLMAIGFLSSNSGHDENVAVHKEQAD